MTTTWNGEHVLISQYCSHSSLSNMIHYLLSIPRRNTRKAIDVHLVEDVSTYDSDKKMRY